MACDRTYWISYVSQQFLAEGIEFIKNDGLWQTVLNTLSNSMACDLKYWIYSSGLYSSEVNTKIIRSQLVRLMAYTLHININNLACEAHGVYSLYLNKRKSTI